MKALNLSLLAIFTLSYTAYAQTNRLQSDGAVGIGTINPIGKLDVRGNTFIGTPDLAIGSVGSFVQIDQGAISGNSYSQIRAFSNGGTTASDLILQSDAGNVGIGAINPTQKLDVVGNILLRNMNNVAGAGSSISFSSYGSEHPGPRIASYLDNAEGVRSQSRLILSSYGRGYNNELTLVNGSVGIGTINPKETLSVNGKIRAQEVKVETQNWPDYVFNPSYQLPSLKEVETYIDKNHHLPEMPSETEVTKDGLKLGEMNKLLVKKVEELTLYLIEEQKQFKQLKQEQGDRISVLEQALASLIEKQ